MNFIDFMTVCVAHLGFTVEVALETRYGCSTSPCAHAEFFYRNQSPFRILKAKKLHFAAPSGAPIYGLCAAHLGCTVEVALETRRARVLMYVCLSPHKLALKFDARGALCPPSCVKSHPWAPHTPTPTALDVLHPSTERKCSNTFVQASTVPRATAHHPFLPRAHSAFFSSKYDAGGHKMRATLHLDCSCSQSDV